MSDTAGGRIIWLASYPKSGNTWLRLLIGNYLADDASPLDINRINLDSPYPIMKNFLEEESFVDPNLLLIGEMNQLRSCIMEEFVRREGRINYIKVHDKCGTAADGTSLFGRGNAWSAIYMVRDPRDVAVSLAFHNGLTFDKAIAMLNNPKQTIGRSGFGQEPHVTQGIGDWSTHVASWADQTDIAVHVLRYEDLCTDPGGAFAKALTFIGLETRAERVKRAVRFTDFAELQRQESESAFSERPAKAIAPFFRSGRVGAWAEKLTRAQSDAIIARHSPMMERFGYL